WGIRQKLFEHYEIFNSSSNESIDKTVIFSSPDGVETQNELPASDISRPIPMGDKKERYPRLGSASWGKHSTKSSVPPSSYRIFTLVPIITRSAGFASLL